MITNRELIYDWISEVEDLTADLANCGEKYRRLNSQLTGMRNKSSNEFNRDDLKEEIGIAFRNLMAEVDGICNANQNAGKRTRRNKQKKKQTRRRR